MDLVFVLIVISPALIVTRYEMKEEKSWIRMLGRFAEWFYVITFANMILLYIRGWGNYDFTFFSVQFLVKYMVSSIGAAVLAVFVKGFLKNWHRSDGVI